MEEKKKVLRIGVDFGGVLTPHGKDYEKGQGNISQMNMPGCISALEELKKDGHYLVLVSFCGRSRAESTRKNLPLKDYFDEVYFVKDRKYKNLICQARALDVLIDDRKDILDSLEVTQGILFGDKPAKTWSDVLKLLPTIKSLNLQMDETIDIYRLIYK